MPRIGTARIGSQFYKVSRQLQAQGLTAKPVCQGCSQPREPKDFDKKLGVCSTCAAKVDAENGLRIQQRIADIDQQLDRLAKAEPSSPEAERAMLDELCRLEAVRFDLYAQLHPDERAAAFGDVHA